MKTKALWAPENIKSRGMRGFAFRKHTATLRFLRNAPPQPDDSLGIYGIMDYAQEDGNGYNLVDGGNYSESGKSPMQIDHDSAVIVENV